MTEHNLPLDGDMEKIQQVMNIDLGDKNMYQHAELVIEGMHLDEYEYIKPGDLILNTIRDSYYKKGFAPNMSGLEFGLHGKVSNYGSLIKLHPEEMEQFVKYGIDEKISISNNEVMIQI